MHYGYFQVWFTCERSLRTCTPEREKKTRAELQACVHALAVAPPLQLCVDSQLATDGVTLWLSGWIRRKWKTKQGLLIANRDPWQDLHTLLQDRQAPTEWIGVPLHVGLYGNGMADTLADLGLQKHGVRMQGLEQPTPKRQAEWARDRGDPELGSQGLASLMAATDGVPSAGTERPHAGGGVHRLMFLTYVDIEDQRRDEGHRYAVFLAHRAEALALRSAEEEDQGPLMAHMHICEGKGCSGNGTARAGGCWRDGGQNGIG